VSRMQIVFLTYHSKRIVQRRMVHTCEKSEQLSAAAHEQNIDLPQTRDSSPRELETDLMEKQLLADTPVWLALLALHQHLSNHADIIDSADNHPSIRVAGRLLRLKHSASVGEVEHHRAVLELNQTIVSVYEEAHCHECMAEICREAKVSRRVSAEFLTSSFNNGDHLLWKITRQIHRG